MRIDFTDKTVVITGGTSGMGLAAATAFLQSGANVVICGRGQEKLSRALEGLSVFGAAAGMTCDVSKKDDVEALADFALSRFQGVDVWINNAGVMGKRPLMEERFESFDTIMQNNVYSVLYGAQAACRVMRQGGVILNTASYSGGKPSANQGAYSASKAAVVSLTATLAAELAPRGIRVLGVSPGSIQTDMTEGKSGPTAAALNRIPGRRFGTPDEVASLMLFLCSAQAQYLSGFCFPIDGGKLAVQAPEDAWG